MHEVVLCADEEMLRDPSMMGLDGESLEGQDWLLALSGAQEARDYLRGGGRPDEVWVASSDEVDPINLAAAMKRDCREMKVCLVAWQGSGSLMSRANAAGIDEVMGYPAMARRYAERKAARRRGCPPVAAASPGRVQPDGASVAMQDEGARRDGVSPDDAGLPVMRDERPAAAEAREGLQPAADAMNAAGGGGQIAVSADAPARRGFALCVVSASGGAGKSTVAALSAIIAAGHGYRTALIDADLQFGDAAAMFGEEGGLSVDKAVADPHLIDDAIPRPGYPVVVAAPERIEQSELYLPQMPGLIDRACDSFDVVVVNTGSFWTESHVQMMEASTNTLFLMDQRPSSVNAVRKALSLCARCGVAAHPFLFAVNRCSRKSMLSSLDVSCALNGVEVAELKDGGSAVGELLSAGMPMELLEDRNELCVSLNDFLGRVIPSALGGAASEPALKPERKHKGKAKRKAARRKGKAACL